MERAVRIPKYGPPEVLTIESIERKRETPRLCRGGSSSLTFTGVPPRFRREPPLTRKEAADGRVRSKPHDVGLQIPRGFYPEISA